MSCWTTRGIVGSSTLPAATSLMKLGARTEGASFFTTARFSGSRVKEGM